MSRELALALIPAIHSCRTEVRPIEVAEIADAISTVRLAGSGPIFDALVETLTRLLETNLLHDERFLRIGERWEAVFQRAPNEINGRVKELLGIDCPAATIEHFAKILGGSGFRRGRRAGAYEDYFPELLREALEEKEVNNRLRCGCCGYHFRAADIGKNPARIAAIEDAGAILAEAWDPLRADNRDRWKPTHRVKNQREVEEKGQAPKNDYFTYLTIDHVVPEESFGSSELKNLSLLCNFCNVGKMAHRFPLEIISHIAAGGLSDYPNDRSINMLGQTVVVSALTYAKGICCKCGKTNRHVEMSVKPRIDLHDQHAKGMAPWNFDVVCYACMQDVNGSC